MSSSELAPGITSLSEALSLAIAWLDGDSAASIAANNSGGNSSSDDSPPPSDATTTHQTPIEKAITLLANLQTQISRNGLLSKNEALDDVSTSSLELLGVEYQLGRAYLTLPTYAPPPSAANGATGNGSHNSTIDSPSPSLLRKRNVTRAIEYYHLFLKRLEQLGEDMLQEATLKEFHSVLDLEDLDDSTNKQSSGMNRSEIRDMKIQRFQRKKATTQKRLQLQSVLQRRSRLGLAEEESMEGHDSESLSRTLFIETLRMYAEESLEEIQSSKGELEMLDMAIKMESARMQGMDPRMNRNGGRGMAMPHAGMRPPPNAESNQQPLQMTQITQHPITGELEYTKQRVSNGQLQPVQTIQREEVGKTIFRPSWNQPTMTLEELGDKERAEAIQRSEDQKIAEAESKFKPKRYEQLVKDGMEDNDELVEASAKLDREWDDWKEENPRGSGN
eukprot:CAMPEP_0201884658 /NCGR_PEP_ID=MMETSP0902-20130614/17480_1 /ASSEMBLY_ACC=CAM_ASM_000551 /TAXON_ID=420261 /ORGANISM="Thalassiosira antarctica, Strain CCMP982" /LENGTH=447 /DNA_ID=CAMNT_0048413655 /DNA_START=53 /DNA_END=1393 /DNA_ORIENTATION=-